MSDVIGTCSFLPWLRQGIANSIQTEAAAAGTVKLRASVSVALDLGGEGATTRPISKVVALYGPGDIIGIDSKAIIKTEPRNWITNFEPNYIPYIDFYDEDFPWRYTPASPDKGLGRLCPWIMLAVLGEDEFRLGENTANRPLPYITFLKDAGSLLPPADQLWAWAHVHINEDIVKLDEEVESSDPRAVLDRFKTVLANNPDLAYSRILCPRKLAADTAYHAFLIPAFESGRLAGLSNDPGKVLEAFAGVNLAEPHSTYSAWKSYNNKPEPECFPYYYRWYFRTGAVGDFEYLVRLLERKPIDRRVGLRDLDVQAPGSNVPGILDPGLKGVLKLGGALQVPFQVLPKEDRRGVLMYENWDRLDRFRALNDQQITGLLEKSTITRLNQNTPHQFQEELASFINLADDYSGKEAADANRGSTVSNPTGEGTEPDDADDPLITPPLYGRWHARVQRLLHKPDGTPVPLSKNWVHELNLDPRWRVAAGLGARVVQDHQEEYMDAAWEQVGEVLSANRRIRQAQLARETSAVLYGKQVKPMKDRSIERALAFSAPLQKRILVPGSTGEKRSTVYHRMSTSRVPHAVVSAPMRRIVRPRGRLMRSLRFTERIRPGNLIDRINKKDVWPARPKKVADAVLTLSDLSRDLKSKGGPGFILDQLAKYPWLQYLPLLLAVLLLAFKFALGLIGMSLPIIGTIVTALLVLYAVLGRWSKRAIDAESVLEKNQKPAAVGRLPKSSNFRVIGIKDSFRPSHGGSDNPEADRFKDALRSTYTLVELDGATGAIPEMKKLDLPMMVEQTIGSIDPDVTIPGLILDSVRIPKRIAEAAGSGFREVMAYPRLDIPMYKPLADISTELFLPNINYVTQNSISLVTVNQRFIEAYMASANEEFARELLWREFPTDQRGSYFRQFWDVSSYLGENSQDEEALKERLRDIPPLHLWPRSSNLGNHDQRRTQGDESELVLVIRGELLKRYPTAVIYAQKAKWPTTGNGARELADPSSEELENRPRSVIKTPLYEAKVDPDIYFFGFDLTIEQAKGSPGGNHSGDPGWFFVIKERPGEPRFGLDTGTNDGIDTWNDLAWGNMTPGVADGGFITVGTDMPELKLPNDYPDDPDAKDQYMEDKRVTWNSGMDAAEVAYILHQVPVLVAVHACEMLPKK